MKHSGAQIRYDAAAPKKIELEYFLQDINLNQLLGQEISLSFTGIINCTACGRQIKKSFNQGYCFPCFQKLAECDLCILKPETCHYAKGTCRQPDWAKDHCLKDHIVYLANSTGVKVGISRYVNLFTRWGDQGATQALPIARVSQRLDAGIIEVEIAKHINDKSDWRALLKGTYQEVDLLKSKKELIQFVPEQFKNNILDESSEQIFQFSYPILNYLEKASSYNLDKDPQVQGKLNGIRGQYLLIGDKAINIRKYTGYQVEFNC